VADDKQREIQERGAPGVGEQRTDEHRQLLLARLGDSRSPCPPLLQRRQPSSLQTGHVRGVHHGVHEGSPWRQEVHAQLQIGRRPSIFLKP
jgi:hypothetical protein